MAVDELNLSLQYYARAACAVRAKGAAKADAPAEAPHAPNSNPKKAAKGPVAASPAPAAGGGALPDCIKVLFVHGFCQNAQVFAGRTSNLRSKAMKVPGKLKLECVFAESPLAVHDLLRPEDPELDPRGWYNPREAFDGDGSVRPVDSKIYVDWQEPLETLRRFCQEQGPMHGVLAFSQGGIAAATMLLEQQMRFGIFVSCFAPQDPKVQALFAETGILEVPTLHFIGRSDPFVVEERSLQLARMFKDPVVLYHEGGHIMIPKELFPNVKEFLANVLGG